MILAIHFAPRIDKNMTEQQAKTTETFTDPICGMQVAPTSAASTFNQEGETFYFCSTGCLQRFIAPSDEKPSGCCGSQAA